MNILDKLTKKLIYLIGAFFLYVISILVFNTDKGFDITDESYYILQALYPNDVYSIITHEGYYTGLLFWLSGYNLSYFRLLGILILIGISIYLSLVIIKYISIKLRLTLNNYDKILFTFPVVLSSMSFYNLWILTPSYNWLALLSSMLMIVFMISIVNNKEINYSIYITKDYFLFSFSISLAFMSKPTMLFGLIFVSLLFLIYEYKRINYKKAIPSIIITTFVILSLHIIFLDGGFSTYFERLEESITRAQLLDNRYTLYNRFENLFLIISQSFFESFYFHKVNNFVLYTILIILLVFGISRKKLNIKKYYIVFISLLFTSYSYYIYIDLINTNLSLLWIRLFELFIIILFLKASFVMFLSNKIKYFKNIFLIVPFLMLIILLSLSITFGTNNNLIYSMSSSLVFICIPMIILALLIDKVLNISLFSILVNIVFLVYINSTISYAFEHPYRLVTNIEGQNKKVEFLGGLFVDKIQKKYIEDLQDILKDKTAENKNIDLLDMTGGSPGANIILEANIFNASWLIGGYEGSNEFVYRILSEFKNTRKLKKAWILISRKGRRKSNLNILDKLKLNFPEEYVLIKTIKTAHRNELQELWVPIVNE